MTNTQFVYTTYIKTTPQKLWEAITNPEFIREYWSDGISSDWKKGSRWQSLTRDKTAVKIEGEVLESVPPKRLVYTWKGVDDDSGTSRVTFDIQGLEGGMTRLDVVHSELKAGSEMVKGISKGWPAVLSNLKSMLETGAAFDVWSCVGGDCGGSGKAA